MNIIKIILLVIITVAFIGITIKDWPTYGLLDKIFMIGISIGFAGLAYNESS